jgi:beta-phosphoglucomutase family hydrolase
METKVLNWPKVSIDTEKDLAMCFGCGQDNPIGLKLKFNWDGKVASARFAPNKLYQGWSGLVHGGIITALLDEAMAYAALFGGVNTITATMEAKFKHPAPLDKPLIINGSIIKKTRRLVETKATIALTDGTLIAEGTATQFIVSTKPSEASKAKAIIWDMDGVIVDTAPYHLKAWQEVFQKRGVAFTKEDFRRNFGQRNDTIILNTLGELTLQSEIDAIGREKERKFRNAVRQNIKPLPGAIELIKSLAPHGFKLALASSAPIENIKLLTKGLGIDKCFYAIISGGDVTEGKPSPQGFLLAAQRLGVEPKNCIVTEDAIAGITAAKRAGMYCLAVTNTHPRPSLTEADLVVDTLEAVNTNDLEQLLKPLRED